MARISKPKYRLRLDGSFELATHDGWVPVFSRDHAAPHVRQDLRNHVAQTRKRLSAPVLHSIPQPLLKPIQHGGLGCVGQSLTGIGQ